MVLIYLITENAKEAKEVGKHLITERLANSANIVPAVRTMKWSEGEVVDENETLLLIKTKALLYSTIEKRISELLSTPKLPIFSIPLTQINDHYRERLIDGVQAV